MEPGGNQMALNDRVFDRFRIRNFGEALQNVYAVLVRLKNIAALRNIGSAFDLNYVQCSSYRYAEKIDPIRIAGSSFAFDSKFSFDPRGNTPFCLIEHPSWID